MSQTIMEQTLSNSWPKRFRIMFTNYDIACALEAGTRFILSLLTLTILVGLAGGVVKTFLDLRLLLSADVEVALRQVLVDTLTLLAVVEVLKLLIVALTVAVLLTLTFVAGSMKSVISRVATLFGALADITGAVHCT